MLWWYCDFFAHMGKANLPFSIWSVNTSVFMRTVSKACPINFFFASWLILFICAVKPNQTNTNGKWTTRINFALMMRRLGVKVLLDFIWISDMALVTWQHHCLLFMFSPSLSRASTPLSPQHYWLGAWQQQYSGGGNEGSSSWINDQM